MDIIRLIIAILIGIAGINSYYTSFSTKKNKSFTTTILMLFQPDLFLNTIVCLVYIIIFALRINNFNINQAAIFSFSTTKFPLSQTVDQTSFAFIFQVLFMLETIVLFAVLSRLLFITHIIQRFEIFYQYIVESIKNAVLFFCILGYVFIGLAIFANVIFGQTDDTFRDFPSALISILLVSSGHSIYFSSSAESSTFLLSWKTFYITLYVLYVIFIFLGSFIGLYYLSYRIVSARESTSFNQRLLNKVKIEAEYDKINIESG